MAPDTRRLELAPDALRPITAELAGAPDARAVLIAQSAPAVVAARLAEGAPARSALKAWRDAAELELSVFRTNRRRILLLDSEDVSADPDQARAAMMAWFDDGVLPQTCAHAAPEDMAANPDRLIAELLCASDSALRGLMTEQAASCAWINRAPPAQPLHAACSAAERLTALLADQSGASAEIWRDALEAAQASLQVALTDDSQLREAQEEFDRSREALKSQAAGLESRLREARREVQDLRTMLHACESQLARMEADRAVLSDARQQAEDEIARVRVAAENSERHRLELLAEREHILSSEVWRFTAPIRWVINTLGRRT
ncbi:MAG: hypothetical protein JJU18_09085 [Oceanicaulis sp.]|nr:hypothetical protein [Oceanicaulis sp.]